MKNLFKRIFSQKFKSYWKKVRDEKNFDDDLRFISDQFINSSSYKFVSKQWEILNIHDYNSIKNNGIDNFGSDISTHYFTFMDYTNDHLNNLFKNIEFNLPINLKTNIFKKHKNFDYKTSINYNLLCLLLFENLKKTNLFPLLDKLNDNTYLGFNHPFIEIDNFKISSDKIVSLFDFDKINKFYELKKVKRILEIGAGSGRLSECILSLNSNINYVICDIPPSLYISYKRLKIAFPNKKINLAIDINDDKLEEQIIENDITFIFPHQIDVVKNNFYDLVVAVDCLHEMDKKTHATYFNFINKISEYFYFSIWDKTKNWHSGNLFKKTERLDFDKGDYNIPKNWEKIFRENLKFPSNHLGLGFKILK